MPSGIFSANILNFANGTTEDGPSVTANDNQLKTNGVNNDGGLITTDGLGVLTALGFKTSSGTLPLISKFGPYTITVTPTFFNHNLKDQYGNNVIPDIIIVQVVGTSNNVYTVEYDTATLTSTQVKLTSNSNSPSVMGIALKLQ